VALRHATGAVSTQFIQPPQQSQPAQESRTDSSKTKGLPSVRSRSSRLEIWQCVKARLDERAALFPRSSDSAHHEHCDTGTPRAMLPIWHMRRGNWMYRRVRRRYSEPPLANWSSSRRQQLRSRRIYECAAVLGTPTPAPPPPLPQHSEDGEVSDRRAAHLWWWCGPGTRHDASGLRRSLTPPGRMPEHLF
jgi:hypothetical protein